MKSIFVALICCLLYFSPSIQSQTNYNVDGKNYALQTEVKGDLELLWNINDGEQRYFLKKDDYIVELVNTQIDGHYIEEYKKVLEKQTADAPVSTRKIKFTLPALRYFFVSYNSLKDANFVDERSSIQLQLFLGGYVGVTNSVHTENNNNETQAVIGAEMELVDPIILKRHVAVVDLRHTFESKDNPYSAFQASLSYRFKFIKTEKFEAYAGVKFATFTSYTTEIKSGSGFSSPIAVGVGAAYKLGNGFITFGYHDILGLNLESNNEFPINFSLGYKIRL